MPMETGFTGSFDYPSGNFQQPNEKGSGLL